MKTDNDELIAEFVGARWSIFAQCWKGGDAFIKHYLDNATELHFHLSWDWLMPVFSKFSSLDTNHRCRHLDLCASISEKILEVDIHGSHERLIEGIKWYNSQKKEA